MARKSNNFDQTIYEWVEEERVDAPVVTNYNIQAKLVEWQANREF